MSKRIFLHTVDVAHTSANKRRRDNIDTTREPAVKRKANKIYNPRKKTKRAGGYSRAKSAYKYSANRRTAGYIGIEKKYLDTSYNAVVAAPTDATGGEADPTTFLSLTSVAQGDTQSNRDGKKIVGKYLEIKGQVYTTPTANQTTGPPSTSIMVACVLDTQTNAAQLNSEDVFINPAATAVTAPFALRDLEYGSRFKILKQEYFVLDIPGVYDGTNIEWAATSKPFCWYIPLKDLVINFTTGTTGVIANVMDNSIHMVAFADDSTGQPQLAYNSRFRFIG